MKLHLQYPWRYMLIRSHINTQGARRSNLSRRMRFEPLETRELLSGAPAADPILFWNEVALDSALVDSRAASPEQNGPTRASRAMAIVHAAMYDAWNGVDRQYEPYLVQSLAPRGTSGEAAVAQSAHDTLAALYPHQRAAFDRALAEYLAEVPDGRGERLGQFYGHLVAGAILQARSNDGSAVDPPYTAGTEPGQHRPDPLNPNQGFLTPGWGDVTPFAIPSADAFPVPSFPALTSEEYAAALNEVRVVGALDAEVRDRDGNGRPDRTDSQTEIGIFWGYDQRLGTPLRLFNDVVRSVAIEEHNSISENARLFALTNIAMADAGIACWDVKYIQNIWRPIVGIREADTDGNPDTVAEPDWKPLGAPGNNGDPPGFPGEPGHNADPDPVGNPDFTPPFPSYTSGHATFGGALFQVLTNFYGTDEIPFRVYSEDAGVTHSFTSFMQARDENFKSRIYLGVHWHPDCEVGDAQGQAIGNYVSDHLLQPPSHCARESGGHKSAGGDSRLLGHVYPVLVGQDSQQQLEMLRLAAFAAEMTLQTPQSLASSDPSDHSPFNQ